MLGDFASLDVQNTYRGSDAYVYVSIINLTELLGFFKVIENHGQSIEWQGKA
ncbi:hypothetical protein ACR9PT_00800 [Piscirickettsia salmonis]|uniref:hypothetical protein n=1 Tax=Piscirickettsia salmonis TaxID=1238 RepID=UPI003EB7CAE3